MGRETDKSPWSLPYSTPTPGDGGTLDGLAMVARIGCYLVLAAAIIVPSIQFQAQTASADARGKPSKGAIGRWRLAGREFWEGRNIYRAIPTGPQENAGKVYLHPNMPFTIMLLSPFSYMPAGVTAAVFSLLKAGVLIAAGLMLTATANHQGRRMPDWVVGLALLWAIMLIVADIQHGNTNGFVLGALALHLWLYRKGRDLASGCALALAVCLKMTPAIFLLYWLYQRNWRLLGAAAVALALAMTVIPAGGCIAMRGFDISAGIDHWRMLTATWWENLIAPGLLKAAPYPIHINQSLPGVLSRYFLDGQYGDAFWNPDDFTYAGHVAMGAVDPTQKPGWITIAPLPIDTVKWITRLLQLVIVAVMAWAIGWRKLARDDGRRMLHYGLVAVGMLLLNQRTWDQHAGVMLILTIGLWHAIAFGRMSAAARKWALGLAVAAGPLIWLGGSALFIGLARLSGESDKTGERWFDWAKAWGPTFWYFVLMLAATVVAAVAMRNCDEPYATRRQTLSAG
ncbi:MAG: glycosyltransferase family 87 protein [Phycisphaerae bacterium]